MIAFIYTCVYIHVCACTLACLHTYIYALQRKRKFILQTAILVPTSQNNVIHYVRHTNYDYNHSFYMDLSLVYEKAAFALSGFG